MEYISNKEDSLVSIKIYEPKGTRKIQYIAHTKTWHDDFNGNTYWSCRVEDIENDLMYVFPFQYGYGDQSEHTVKRALGIKNRFGEKSIIKFYKKAVDTEEEADQHGTENEDNYNSRVGYYYLD